MARAFGLAMLLIGTPLAAQQIDYSYKYPPRVAAFAPLKAWFDADARATRAKFDRDLAEARIGAKKDGYPFRGWTESRDWKVVAETPRFLSLSLEGWAYTGGAHGNSWYGAMLYDKTVRQRLKPIDLFVAPARLSAIIRKDFCRRLDSEREERRSEPVDHKAMFGECIDPVNQTVILGSKLGRAFDRIGFLIGPYAAGSYAEGSYDVTLTVTAAILAQVTPQYRAAFAVVAR